MSKDIKCIDTICALSSGAGLAAISIVRISGTSAKKIVETITVKKDILPLKPVHTQIIDEDGSVFDDVIVLYFPCNKSYTGQELFEIYAHGNPLIVEKILQLMCSYGARLAEAGEFTMRSFLNGKMDLTAAESVSSLIHATSLTGAKIALKGINQGLKTKLMPIRQKILYVLGNIEARFDFADENLGTYDRDELLKILADTIFTIENFIQSAKGSLNFIEGAKVAICGSPNAGKSTLLNALLEEERSIVHKTAGTTRDIVEGRANILGMFVTLQDLAGIRDVNCADEIEQIGIQKALDALQKCDLVIWLCDITNDHYFDESDIKNALLNIKVPVLKVLNKCDESIKAKQDISFDVKISAKEGQNILLLKELIKKSLTGDDVNNEEAFLTKARQKKILQDVAASLKFSQKTLHNREIDEIVCGFLREALQSLDDLFGTDMKEDVLDLIFKEFCIGK